MSNAEYTFEILKEEYELSDDNAADVRWALSFGDEYSEYVQKQAQIVIESINLGQSTLALGELMRPLYQATHKLSTLDNEIVLPGVEYFEMAAKVASEALEYIKSIGLMTEQFAECALSCDETIDVSYM